MAKKNPIFYLTDTDKDLTRVDSRRYGTHWRKRRGSMKPVGLNETFQKAVELNDVANPMAKVIKDALDPYREDFPDGSMWGRLVGLFKKHLLKNPSLDFGILEDFELHGKISMHGSCHYEMATAISERPEASIRIELTTSPSTLLIKFHPTGYQLTLIGVFLDADHKATTRSECVTFPIKWTWPVAIRRRPSFPVADKNQQITQWPIPAGTKTILLVLKSEACRGGKVMERKKVRGMKVVGVVGV